MRAYQMPVDVIDDAGPTPASIAAAKLAAQLERAEVYRQTGILITESGRVVWPGRGTDARAQ